jgi:Ser/Thr protein kinase RdoA (MazF antagonist)
MNPNHLLELLDTPAPAVSAAEAVQIAQTQFGIKAAAKPLVSDKDCNFLLETSDGPVAVIKISNSAEDPAVLDLQNRALLHIESTDPSLPVPRLRYTRDGQMHYLLKAANGESHVVRVLSWLEGDILDRQQVAAGLSTAIGTMLARLARSLRGFFHPAAGHQIIWDIKNALQLKKLPGFNHVWAVCVRKSCTTISTRATYWSASMIL